MKKGIHSDLAFSVSWALVLFVLLLQSEGTASATTSDRSRDEAASDVRHVLLHLPLVFEANHGQVDPRVKYIARGPHSRLFLTPTEAVLALNPSQESEGVTATLRMRLLEANGNARLVGREKQSGIVNYFIGSDPARWKSRIPTYAKVEYQQVYPGIDLVYYGSQQQLEYDFIVSPGADPTRIALTFQGADQMEIDATGALLFKTAAGEIRQHRPRMYQVVNGSERTVEGGYVLRPVPAGAVSMPSVAFRIDSYDSSLPLIIDPILSYSTYLGGSGSDQGFSIAVDQTGAAYVAGATSSSNFPSGSPKQAATGGGEDAFVTKLSVDGPAIVYSTYLGGSGDDNAFGITVDSSGNAYVTGVTASSNFPTANPLQSSHGGGTTDAFIAKLNGAGAVLTYATYLGGNGADVGDSLALDSTGNLYVTGYTSSTNFRTVSAIQSAPGGNGDAFVSKVNAAGSALVYSTYLGGTGYDEGFGIAVDASNNAYVTGATRSFNFPTTSPLQAFMGNSKCADDGSVDSCDTFVSKVNAAGSALVYSTYLGGNGPDIGFGIAVDAAGNAYVSGRTASSNFPTVNPLQSALGGVDDAFVSKLNAAGSALIYSTYLGGNNYEDGFDITVDASGNAYVVGSTSSTNFPTVSPLQTTLGGDTDAYVVKINPTGSSLIFASYLGGATGTGQLVLDEGLGVAIDTAGTIYVTGASNSSDFPTTPGVVQSKLGGSLGSDDAFVAKISFSSQGVSLTVTRAGTGSGTVSSNPTGITCSPTCVANFSNGSKVTLTAASASGSTFSGWSGGGCSGTASCTVTLSGATGVTATFASSIATFGFTVNKAGSGSGTVSCAGTGVAPDCSGAIASGTVVTLTAAPTAPATFGGWSGCTAVSGMPTQCTVTVKAATVITATFASNVPMFGLTVKKAGVGTGSVSCAGMGVATDCSGKVATGTVVTLTAAPAPTAGFGSWSGCTPVSGTPAQCTVTVKAATTVTATFTRPTFALTVNKAGAGSGNVTCAGTAVAANCTGTIANGTVVTLTAVPKSPSTFDGWSGCTPVSGALTKCTVTMTAATSVTATFAPPTFSLTVKKTGTGTGAVSCAGTGVVENCSEPIISGTLVTLTATPTAPATVGSWSGCMVIAGTPTQCNLTMKAATTVTATFTIPKFALTVSKTGSGSGSVSCAGADVAANCSGAIVTGTVVTLTASPTASSNFGGWNGCMPVVGTPTQCTVTMTAATRVTATFGKRK